jgi:hypothetical protein
MLPSVEEDQVASLGPDDGAGPLDRAGAGRGPVVREDELASLSEVMIGTEEQAGQRVGVDMTFEPHGRTALDVEDDAVPFVEGRHDRLGRRLPGQFQETAAVGLVQPGQASTEVGGIKPATGNRAHAC